MPVHGVQEAQRRRIVARRRLRHEAVLEGARIRFRPILMTTVSTVMGSLPLIMAVGAGSESRVTLGIVIFSGVTFATFLSLFIVPALYSLLARRTQSPGAVTQRLERMQTQAEETVPPPVVDYP